LVLTTENIQGLFKAIILPIRLSFSLRADPEKSLGGAIYKELAPFFKAQATRQKSHKCKFWFAFAAFYLVFILIYCFLI
jgi:hypothetical protein